MNNKVSDIIASTYRHRLEPQRPTTSTYQDKDQATVAISEMQTNSARAHSYLPFPPTIEIGDLDTGSHLPSETDVVNIGATR